MKHLSNEDLILYHYRDGDGIRKAERHLAACLECRLRLKGLAMDLEILQVPETSHPAEDYGSKVWNEIRASLSRPEANRQWRWAPRFAAACTLLLLVVGAFLLGRFYRPQPLPSPRTRMIVDSATPQLLRERILLAAVGDHLDRSQILLIDLSHMDGKGIIDISGTKDKALELVSTNRLYRTTARDVGDAKLAAALDELERTLLEIAHESPQITEARLKELQQGLYSQGILFKVRVVRINVQQEIRKPGVKSAAPERKMT
jgi:hypothetical protein